MTESTQNLLENLQVDSLKIINDMEQENEIEKLDTLKEELLVKWKNIYTELNKEIANSEFNVSVPSTPKTKKLTKKLVAQHLLRNDDADVAALIPDLDNTIKDFLDLKKIENGIKEHDLNPLSELIQNFHFKNNKLEFYYHALQYLLLLKNISTKEALLYLKTNCHNLVFRKELKSLLTLSVIPKKIQHYINIYTSLALKQLRIDYALIYSIPNYDALEILYKGGSDSLNNLVKASDVFEQYQINFEEGGTLPVDLEVPVKHHSVFICPVLKVFCGEENPPMRLKCGHVISSVAVERMSKENILTVFKCPYCPTDSKLIDIKELKL